MLARLKFKSPFFLGFTILLSASYAQLTPGSVKSFDPVYSHQFTFQDRNQWKFVDTTHSDLRWYHQFNALGVDLFGGHSLGSMGNPILQTVPLFNDDLWTNFEFGAYSSYFGSTTEIPFYETKSALTEANFWGGYERGQSFNVYHTQNIKKDWNFLVSYKRVNDLGFYDHNRNIFSRILLNNTYQSKSGGYRLRTYFLNEKLVTQENGGIESDSLFEGNHETNRLLYNVRLSQDSRRIKSREFYVNQEMDLMSAPARNDSTKTERSVGGKSLKLLLGHTLKSQLRSSSYLGYSDGYYSDVFTVKRNDEYFYDTTGYRAYLNTVYLKIARDTSYDFLKVGLRHSRNVYKEEVFKIDESHVGLIVNGGYALKRIRLSTNSSFILGGERAGDFEFTGRGSYEFEKGASLFVEGKSSLKSVNYFNQVHYSTNFIWNNSFDPTSMVSFTGGVRWGDLNGFSVSRSDLKNLTYFNESGISTQEERGVGVTRVKLTQNFAFWKWLHVDNDLVYQNLDKPTEAVKMPDLVLRSSVYFEFKLFKRALNCLIGVENNLFTEYQMPSYNPATARFYSANEKMVGGFPIVDLFAAFQLQNARIFVKLEHINQGLNGYEYYAAPHFPFPDRTLRFGLTWRFFN